jgi:lincosamide nucleotidyltransferase
MTPDEYLQFTESLIENVAADGRVLGLVALGSMAARDYLPDQWSDHDFFVIVRSGQQESMRADLSWLPFEERIVLSFRETAHGLKVLYANGHLLEFAVFNTEELHLARVNRYQVLLDREQIARHLEEIEAATSTWVRASTSSDEVLFGQLVTNVLVGIGRYRRGERLSAAHFVKASAARSLVMLLGRNVPSPRASVLDDLDPLRRFEVAYPELGAELDGILGEPVPTAGRRMLEVARRELADRLPDCSWPALDVVLERVGGAC